MDLSFDIRNSEGDHLLVALSNYDNVNISLFSTDPQVLALEFYDVTLIRKAGAGYVGNNVLFAITDILANFLTENSDAVLCFYCDANTDVLRNHKNLLPQEYRSRLFSRMFDLYMKLHKRNDFINHRVEIEDPEARENLQIAHFICRKEQEGRVEILGNNLMQK